MNDDLIGAYAEQAYPFWRTAGEDTARLGRRRNHVPILLEVDVTGARAALAARKQEGGGDVGFTAWAAKCIAQAASQYPRVHGLVGRRRVGGALLRAQALAGRLPRRVADRLAAGLPLGPRTIVTFKDVDLCLAVYRRLSGDEAGERIPMPFVVRKAEEKSLEALSQEIRAAQSRPLPQDQQWLDPVADVPPPWLVRLAFAAPARLRDWLYWDRLLADPFRVKQTMGTIMLTSVPLSTPSGGAAWGIPSGLHPLILALGAVGRRGEREVLSMTVLFDHDVVDALPVALFLRRLTDLMESAAGL